MAKVYCDVSITESYLDWDTECKHPREDVNVTCPKCGRKATAYGSHQASKRRALMELSIRCNEGNFYVENENG